MSQVGKLIERLPLPLVPPNLKIGHEIDRGAYGTVCEGELGGQPVAVKKVHQLLVDGAEDGEAILRRFFEECKRLRDLDHPNVIKFRGVFKDAKLGVVLVMEKMKENLRRFLERHQDTLSFEDQIHISLEITRGVAFLHQLDPPMVHRDLNDKNVMFSYEGVVKIGDFGQSKLKEDVYLTTAAPGMLSFMPPECLRTDGTKYNESMDVFSLGVLLLAMGTQQVPTPNMEGIGTVREVKRRERDLQKMSDSHPFKPFILLCLNDDRKQRPKAAEMLIVLSRLDGNVLQTILAADQKICILETDLQQATEHVTTLAKEKQSMQEELSRTESQLQAATECLMESAAATESLQLELVSTKADVQEATERLTALDLVKQNLQEDLFHAKILAANCDTVIRQLQDECFQLDATLKEKEGPVARANEEAKNYQAKYHLAASKRRAAASHIHEPELLVNGKYKGKRKVSKDDSEEKRRMKDHLVQTENETWEDICEWNVQKLQKEVEAKERENMELRRLLAEAGIKTSEAIPSKEGGTSAATNQHFHPAKTTVVAAPQQLPSSSAKETSVVTTSKSIAIPVRKSSADVTSVAPTSDWLYGSPKLPSISSPKSPVVPTSKLSRVSSPKTPMIPVRNPPRVSPPKSPVPAPQSPTVTPKSPAVEAPKSHEKHGLDKESKQYSEEATNAQHHNLQVVDDDSGDDSPEYENVRRMFPRDQAQLRETHNDYDSNESNRRAPVVVLRKARAGAAEARVIRSLDVSSFDTQATATEDLPKCEKCGSTFPWNRVHLRWKHKCEPSEETQSPKQPQRRNVSIGVIYNRICHSNGSLIAPHPEAERHVHDAALP